MISGNERNSCQINIAKNAEAEKARTKVSKSTNAANFSQECDLRSLLEISVLKKNGANSAMKRVPKDPLFIAPKTGGEKA